MRMVIQRVNHASVTVNEKVVGKIEKGFVVLIGVGQNDDRQTADKYLKKMLGLRIFEDENDKTNLSLKRCEGTAADDLTIYALRELQERKPSQFHRSRSAGHGE